VCDVIIILDIYLQESVLNMSRKVCTKTRTKTKIIHATKWTPTETGGDLLVLAARPTKPVLAIRQLHSATNAVTRHGARRLVERPRAGGPTADVIAYVISVQRKR